MGRQALGVLYALLYSPTAWALRRLSAPWVKAHSTNDVNRMNRQTLGVLKALLYSPTAWALRRLSAPWVKVHIAKVVKRVRRQPLGELCVVLRLQSRLVCRRLSTTRARIRITNVINSKGIYERFAITIAASIGLVNSLSRDRNYEFTTCQRNFVVREIAGTIYFTKS